MPKGCKRVGGLSRLRDDNAERVRQQDGVAVAELARDIDFDANAGEALDPIFANHRDIEGRAAGNDRHAFYRGEIGFRNRECDFTFERADISLEGLSNHDRLLEDLLLHVMGVIALLDRSRGRAGLDDLAPDRAIVAIENIDALPPHDGPITLVKISDTLRPGRDREGVRAEVILTLAVADGQRRSHPRANDQVRMVAKQDCDCECADQSRQDRGDRVLRRRTALDLAGN